MTTKDFITYSCFAALFFIGIYLAGFGGGFVCGITFTMVLLVAVGRSQAARAAGRIDKIIQDNLSNNQTQNNGNQTP